MHVKLSQVALVGRFIGQLSPERSRKPIFSPARATSQVARKWSLFLRISRHLSSFVHTRHAGLISKEISIFVDLSQSRRAGAHLIHVFPSFHVHDDVLRKKFMLKYRKSILKYGSPQRTTTFSPLSEKDKFKDGWLNILKFRVFSLLFLYRQRRFLIYRRKCSFFYNAYFDHLREQQMIALWYWPTGLDCRHDVSRWYVRRPILSSVTIGQRSAEVVGVSSIRKRSSVTQILHP